MFTSELGLMDAGIIALLGYAVVFFGLILLMAVLAIMSRFFTTQVKKPAKASTPAAPQAAPAAPAPANAEQPTAPGTAGKLKLYDTPPKTAAMLMAIVADKMGKPLNELRFISIKEVKDK